MTRTLAGSANLMVCSQGTRIPFNNTDQGVFDEGSSSPAMCVCVLCVCIRCRVRLCAHMQSSMWPTHHQLMVCRPLPGDIGFQISDVEEASREA